MVNCCMHIILVIIQENDAKMYNQELYITEEFLYLAASVLLLILAMEWKDACVLYNISFVFHGHAMVAHM